MLNGTAIGEDEILFQAEQLLYSIQNADGGWGYSPEQPSQPEPTALVLLALAKNSANLQTIQRGLDCLLTMQDTSGAFRIPRGFDKSYWPTALAVLALHHQAAAVAQ